MSSEMFPFASHAKYGYDLEFAEEGLKAAGDLAKKYGHRLTMHPGQVCPPHPQSRPRTDLTLPVYSIGLTKTKCSGSLGPGTELSMRDNGSDGYRSRRSDDVSPPSVSRLRNADQA